MYKIVNVRYAIVLLCFMISFVLYVTGCTEKSFSAQDVKLGNNETLSITEAYIIPDPIDAILLNTFPHTISDRSDPEKIIQNIMEFTKPQVKLYKYLERKREYVKTSIFDGIP